MTIWTLGALLIGCGAQWTKTVPDDVAYPSEDQDGDGFFGYVSDGSAPADCDDLNPAVNPDGAEICNGVDDDCDGRIDQEDDDIRLLKWERDSDGDSYGDPGDITESCDHPAGTVQGGGEADCDDTERAINPGELEICEDAEVDEDCDGLINDDDPTQDPSTLRVWLADADGDGLGDPADALRSCAQPEGYIAQESITDCDDSDPDAASCLDPEQLGFLLVGLGDNTAAGEAVGAGDINGDGIHDLIVGAPGDVGGVWLVTGPITESRRLSKIGIGLAGDSDSAGAAVSGVGDLDGDGLEELAVGAWRAGEGVGSLAILRWPVAASALSEIADQRVGDVVGGFLGASLDGAGDVDGDGLDDVIVGAPGAAEVWLLSGPVTGVSAPDGARITGPEWLGTAVAGVGDLDGDGLGDVALGAPGVIYVHLGPVEDMDVADMDVRFAGEGDAGRTLAAGGDITGDGQVDLLMGQGQVERSYPGVTWVMSWTPGDSGGELRWVSAIEGGDQDEAWRADSAGDLDGDGFGDVIIGAPGRAGGGGAHVVYGPAAGVVSLAEAWPVFSGTGERDRLGASVAGGFDADGDGLPDLLLGATGLAEGGEGAGGVYLIPGSTLLALDIP